MLLSRLSIFFDYVYSQVLHSFPTRRSSDLASSPCASRTCRCSSRRSSSPGYWRARCSGAAGRSTSPRRGRSEEHTSELQSHSDLVCRLLLEKKKQLITEMSSRGGY